MRRDKLVISEKERLILVIKELVRFGNNFVKISFFVGKVVGAKVAGLEKLLWDVGAVG